MIDAYLKAKEYKKAININYQLLKRNPRDISIYSNILELQLLDKKSFDTKLEQKILKLITDYNQLKLLSNISKTENNISINSKDEGKKSF